MPRGYLSLVIELHHPLPGPGRDVAADWTSAAVETYWPLLRTLAKIAEAGSRDAITLAVSPSWTALAGDPMATARARAELERSVEQSRSLDQRDYRKELQDFALERWDAQLLGPLRLVRDSGAVEVIPMTASHAWLPGVVVNRIVAEAQVGLAAADHASLLGRPQGIWLPHLAYRPGFEEAIASAGLRYFGVDSTSLVRGTVRPPMGRFGPLVTPPGAAAMGVDPNLSDQLTASGRQLAHEANHFDPVQLATATADHVNHCLWRWRDELARPALQGPAPPIMVARISAHDLGGWWTAGGGFLERLLAALDQPGDGEPITPGRFLDRYPEGPVGRPGPSAGGLMSARPGGSGLLDQCREAADRLADALGRCGQLDHLQRRALAQMVRALLAAQSLDWNCPPGHSLTPELGLERNLSWLAQFAELAGLLMAGRVEPLQLALAERGPAFLPVIDLDRLADRAREG